MADKLQFVSFSSCVDPSFWHKLAQLKLDVDRLGEPVRHLWGYYSNVHSRGLNSVLSVDCSSFNEAPDEGAIVCHGKIINKNTIDAFKNINKEELLNREAAEILDGIRTKALDDPRLLSRFLIICFADIKQHKFTYWFAFPVLKNVVPLQESSPELLENVFSPEETKKLVDILDRKKSFHILETTVDGFRGHDLREGVSRIKEGSLKDFHLVFADSCEDKVNPGWPLRNFLALFAYHCPDYHDVPIRVIALRYKVKNGEWTLGDSLVLRVIIGKDPMNWEQCNGVGWERNEKGTFGPRLANLNSSMNPIMLAESSVDLNLKLMKWQVVPNIDLEIIKNTKCLLLGAGTLGCAVARSLLGWGVRHITFVDSGNVSYSNPVRQHLYQFADVGKTKAPVAANAVKAIFPSVISSGITMTIPMPGHPVGESLLESTKKTIATLDELIQEHDVVFLLMDSRESRWLPTVMGAAHGKIVINAALGFDSYLVIRHGVGEGGKKLGCYFCNDVTAPGNSGQGRTLDQQCTVTRPGVSSIAGSLAVELMVSLLQHEEKGAAPAVDATGTPTEGILGKIPHSIRGFLAQFETILPAIESFKSCVGCSETVVSEYKKSGCDFVLKVLESKKYLEEMTGLTKLREEAILDDVLALSDYEEDY